MMSIFYVVFILWVGWLLVDGLLTGKVWVKGGASDRFSRSLDMQSFAHKVDKKDSPAIYWLNVVFYLGAILFASYIWATK